MNTRTQNARRALIRPGRGFVVVTAGLLALTACGSGSDPATAGGGSCDTAKSKLKLAFVYAATDQNPFQEMALGAKAAAEEDGNVDLNEAAPTSVDGPKAVSLFQAASKTAEDGIAYETVTPDLFVRALNEATDDGIPVIAVGIDSLVRRRRESSQLAASAL